MFEVETLIFDFQRDFDIYSQHHNAFGRIGDLEYLIIDKKNGFHVGFVTLTYNSYLNMSNKYGIMNALGDKIRNVIYTYTVSRDLWEGKLNICL